MPASSVFYGLMISLTSLLLFPSALSQDLALVHTQEAGEASVTSADAEPPEVSSDQVIILASDWLILVT